MYIYRFNQHGGVPPDGLASASASLSNERRKRNIESVRVVRDHSLRSAPSLGQVNRPSTAPHLPYPTRARRSGITGVMEVTKEAYPDPTQFQKVRPGGPPV